MRTPGHQLSYFILLATALYLQTTYGQAIRSHDLCVVGMVTVSVNSTGLIHHVQRDSSVSPCTLLLSGFVSGSYVYIPGVNLYAADCGLSTNITINNSMFCVKGNQSTNTAIVKLTSDQLNITLPSADAQNFTVQYYNNIGVCGTIMALPDRAEVNQLSGVISTSLDDPPKGSNDCEVRLRGLPSPPVYVRFKLLYTTDLPYPLYIGDKNFSHTTPVGSTLLVTTGSERSINVAYLPDDNSFIAFVLTFSVVHCGDIPAIPNTTNTTTDPPWLPDAKVTYACVDEWKLKSDTEFTIECKLNRSREMAVWSDHSNIRCIPEPWCYLLPTSVANSDYTLSEDNLTATYHCLDGYTTNSSVPDITINCTSSDKDTTPWTWTSANFRCDVVECEPTAEYQNITNGEVTVKRYYYTQQLQYQCDGGYVEDVVVNCTKDGNWSALPSCVQAPTTTSTSDWIGSSQSGINTTTTTNTSIFTVPMMSSRDATLPTEAPNYITTPESTPNIPAIALGISTGLLAIALLILSLIYWNYRRNVGNNGGMAGSNRGEQHEHALNQMKLSALQRGGEVGATSGDRGDNYTSLDTSRREEHAYAAVGDGDMQGYEIMDPGQPSSVILAQMNNN